MVTVKLLLWVPAIEARTMLYYQTIKVGSATWQEIALPLYIDMSNYALTIRAELQDRTDSSLKDKLNLPRKE